MTFMMSNIKKIVNISAFDKFNGGSANSWGYSYSSKTDTSILFDYPPTAFYVLNRVECYLQFDLFDAFIIYSYSFVHDDYNQPVNFIFEGTNDTDNWNCILDDRDNVKYKPQNKNAFIWTRFKIKKPKKFRYYRLKLKENGGSSTNNKNRFALYSFDAVLSKPCVKCTVKSRSFLKANILLVNLIMSK